MKFALVLFGLIMSVLFASGQNPMGEGKLSPVDHDGFYRVAISPALSSHANRSFTNLRIHDEKGSDVPYLLQSENPINFTTTFKNYDIVDRSQVKNCCTTILLSNADGRSINNINLSIRNAEVTKRATLMGSDDKENWYALKDEFTISSISNTNNTSEIRIVDFPLSNYSYYKLVISDSLTAPLNVLGAGYYETKSEEGKYSAIPLRTSSHDSLSIKQSFIRLSFDSTQVLDRLVISLKGAPYFLREAQLFIKRMRTNRKKLKEYYYEYVTSFVLSSKQASIIDLDAEFAKDVRIVVDNKDNPPLEVSSIKAFQLNRYLTAWLKAGQNYSVVVGARDVQAPVYDIGHFQDKIPTDVPIIETQAFKMFHDTTVAASKTIFASNLFVWAAIILVIAVLGFMAVKMVRETSARS